MPKITISKMGRPIILIKVKDWSTRRKVLAIVSLVAISILLLPWLRELLNIVSVKNAVVSSREESKGSNGDLFEVSARNVIFETGVGSFITLRPTHDILQAATVRIVLSDDHVIKTIGSFTLQPFSHRQIYIPIHSRDVAGHCVMSFKSDSEGLADLYRLRIQIKVVHQIFFGYLSIVLGWFYVAMWSASYYPQLYRNWRRRSVVGFSFDYIALNITGHICYCAFNASMYYNSHVQKSYTQLHPRSILPVKQVEVFFSIHAVSMNVILIVQCLLYERAQQRVSVTIVTLVSGLWLVMSTGLLSAVNGKITWLKYMYWLSYIKVGSTPIKYMPQLYLNYQRKSTDGWSIYSSMMDGLGGLLSILQMAIDAFNNDDWQGTLGNPGKLGLGIISFLINATFAIQHFILYSRSNAKSVAKL